MSYPRRTLIVILMDPFDRNPILIVRAPIVPSELSAGGRDVRAGGSCLLDEYMDNGGLPVINGVYWIL